MPASLIYEIQEQDQGVNHSGKHSQRLVAKQTIPAADMTHVTITLRADSDQHFA